MISARFSENSNLNDLTLLTVTCSSDAFTISKTSESRCFSQVLQMLPNLQEQSIQNRPENSSCIMYKFKKSLKASFPVVCCQPTTQGRHVVSIVTVMSSHLCETCNISIPLCLRVKFTLLRFTFVLSEPSEKHQPKHCVANLPLLLLLLGFVVDTAKVFFSFP